MGLEKWRCLLQCPRRRPHRGPRRRRPQGLGRTASLTLRRRSVCVPVLMEGSVRAAVRTRLTDTTPSALVTFTTDACTSNRYAEPLPVTHIFTHISEVEYINTDESFLHLAVQSVTWLNQTTTIWMFFCGFYPVPLQLADAHTLCKCMISSEDMCLDCRWTSHLLQKHD